MKLSVFNMALVATLMCSTLAKAEPVAVDKAKAAALNEAVLIAIEKTAFDCDPKGRFELGNVRLLSLYATAVYEDNSGQPAILLVADYEYGSSSHQAILRVETDSTYKKIVKYTTQTLSKERVNKGTLIAPRIVDEFVPFELMTCVAK